MKPFFSIIVPCCDVAPYVRECLDSVRRQAFADWECLVVVETSADGTERIVRETAASNARFMVFEEPRSGSPATPRNTGLDHASGEYVIFLDGDDMLVDDALAHLADKIRERPGADLYPCVFCDWREGRGVVLTMDNWPNDSPAEMRGVESVAVLCGHSHTPFWGAPFTIYRRAFLDERAMRFVPGLVYEDMEFAPRAFCCARRVVPLHEPFYLYRAREDSIMGVSRAAGPKFAHYARALRSLFAFHAVLAKEPGFDPCVSRVLGRAWIALMRNVWFAPLSVASVPRRRRLETLRMVFSDGFGDFHALLAAAPLCRRVAGWCIVAFVRVPVLRGAVEQFLSRVYGRLAGRRRGR